MPFFILLFLCIACIGLAYLCAVCVFAFRGAFAFALCSSSICKCLAR